ncbi:agmatinase family protein [Moheibacter lacus]|uniref:Agmatinase family protein n=1 Tax=Moheibacter lacus TaxID=2745851 RepID=A0A838ZNS0_9FLAO|nr:agmatinase family protein [Moheibacter lacus]MBA5629640.1 agmatinase family protein [Moheibacter lacus]
MSKQEIIDSFDPNQPGLADATLFGLPFSAEMSEIIIVPAPWEVTVSYGSGASDGVDAIFDASFQVDLLHQTFPELWKLGIYMDKEIPNWKGQSDALKELASPIIEAQEAGQNLNENPKLKSDLENINVAGTKFKSDLKERILHWMNQGKLVGLLGGDHSTPLGYYKALAEKHESFGILHLDAHMDLRDAYEGFTYSHASIMFNALKIPQIKKIVQVGIRDFCEQEVEVVRESGKRVKIFTDADLKAEQFQGINWAEQCKAIISELPENVHISFDIDGLYPGYCPNTGTPVPGGFSFEQAAFLLTKLAESGKKIIGFDLVEVAPGEDDWDGNVGARMLFHLCGVLAKSKGLPVGSQIQF